MKHRKKKKKKNLKEASEEKDLHETERGHRRECSKSRWDVSKFVTINVDVAWETDARSSDHVAQHGKHAHATVLDLHLTKAIKAILVRVFQDTKRIPEAQRGLRANLSLESFQGT